MTACSLLIAPLVLSAGLSGQEAAFEVASVKPSTPNLSSPLAPMALVLPQPGGMLRASNATLHRLVQAAYGVEDFQVTGGPPWATSDRFDVTARAPGAGATLTEMQPMLRTLLVERFRLRARTEKRDMPTFALVRARADGSLGPQMRVSQVDCTATGARCGVSPFGSGGGFALRGTGQPIAVVARLVSQALGRPVVDQTGLTGLYDFELAFDTSVLASRAAQQGLRAVPDGPPSTDPSLMTAIQEQLGLRLNGQTSPVDVVVIEGAEPPAPD